MPLWGPQYIDLVTDLTVSSRKNQRATRRANEILKENWINELKQNTNASTRPTETYHHHKLLIQSLRTLNLITVHDRTMVQKVFKLLIAINLLTSMAAARHAPGRMRAQLFGIKFAGYTPQTIDRMNERTQSKSKTWEVRLGFGHAWNSPRRKYKTLKQTSKLSKANVKWRQ